MSAKRPVSDLEVVRFEPVSDVALKNVVLANGPAHPELGEKVAAHLGVPLAKMEVKRFPDSEPHVRYLESYRGKKVIALQTHAQIDGNPVTDSFDIHELMIDGALQADASDVMAVAPSFAGARQDKSVEGYEAMTGALNMNRLRNAGASQLLVMNIHSRQTLDKFFMAHVSYPAKSQTAFPLIASKYAEIMGGRDREEFLMLSGDLGHSTESRKHSDHLGIKQLDLIKDRDPRTGKITHRRADLADCKGKTVFTLDDMIDTAGTLISLARAAKAAKAARIIAGATHAFFSDNAAEALAASPIDTIFVTDTRPISKEVMEILHDKLVIISIAELLGDSIRAMITDGSVRGLTDYKD